MLTSGFLCNVQSQPDETQLLQEDDADDNVFEDDDHSAKQQSTPKRQLNR